MWVRKSEVFPSRKRYRKELEQIWAILCENMEDDRASKFCDFRGWIWDEQRVLADELGIGYVPALSPVLFEDFSKELGLISESGSFVLSERYVLPVYGYDGGLETIIGWYPGVRKYITLAAPFFSKELMFLNFADAYERSMRDFGGLVYVVEGIFDCLSLRACGLPVVSTMGAGVSREKGEVLKVFSRVIGIPDGDAVGHRSAGVGRHGWNFPKGMGSTLVKFYGTDIKLGDMSIHIKDMDDFVKFYGVDEAREVLLSMVDERVDILEWRL